MSAVDISFAVECEQAHRNAFEHWRDGKSVRVWKNKCGVLCIAYESGRYWHYRKGKDGLITWW